MHQSKMALVINRNQVVIILIDLNWRELPLVHNILVAQRAEIEPIVQPNRVGRPLP